MVDQYFGRRNDYMSRPPLESTPLDKNTTNGKTSPSYLITVGTKSPNPMPLILPKYSPELPKYLPGEPDPDPSLSDS